MMPKQANSASLRLCQPRKFDSDCTAATRAQELGRMLRHNGLHLVPTPAMEAKAAGHAAPSGLRNRICQIRDLVLGRGTVWVERRRN
jgi:hypothetical protein